MKLNEFYIKEDKIKTIENDKGYISFYEVEITDRDEFVEKDDPIWNLVTPVN